MRRAAGRASPAGLGALGLLLVAGCLEQTTGEKKELDPRILEQAVAETAAADLTVTGPTITLTGTIVAAEEGPIDVDLSVADPTAAGGRKQVGKVPLDGPGAFELKVPANQAGLAVAFFQDLAKDGPSSEDPYAALELDVAEADLDAGEIELVVGGFARAEHTAAAPGAPGGGTPGSAPAGAVPGGELIVVAAEDRAGVGVQPFADHDGVLVDLRGSVSSPLAAPVDLQVALGDRAGTLVLAEPGPFVLQVPRGAGAGTLTALQDLAADGAGAEDPVATVQIEVGELDVDGVALVLELPAGLLASTPRPAGTAEDGAVDDGAVDDGAVDAGPGADAVPPHTEGAVGAPEAVAHVEMPPGGALDPTAGLAGPFDDYEGATVVVTGTVLANDGLPVDLDLRAPDPESDSGVRNLGKVILASPGEFAVRVPQGFGDLRLEGFQDLDGDGPDGDDPWGAALVDVGAQDVADVRLMLVAGARGSGADHHEVAHSEAASGASASVSLEDVGRPVDPAGVGPFANYRGKMVKLRGAVSGDDPGPVDIDVWIEDAGAPGGMRNQGKIVLVSPGDFVIRVPASAGKMALEAYQDTDADGPTESDLFARVDLDVGPEDLSDLALALATTGSRGGVAGGGGAAPARTAEQDRLPFADHEGPRIVLSGVVRGEQADVVFIDVRVPDPDAPGGMRQAGQVHLQGPGVFQIPVPAGIGKVELEAFQDADANGPDDDDPYGRLSLQVEDRDLQAAIDLVVGGRALAAAAGAPGGGQGAASAGPGEADAFPTYKGERVTISGQIRWDGPGKVDIDLFKTDATAPGGRTIAGKLKVDAGPYSFTAPKDLGQLEIEAFVDVDGDGPSSGDPAGRYVGNPLAVGGEDIAGVDITISGS